MVSAMMNATAPITGGISWLPMLAVASTPPANAGLGPKRFISGMVNCPVVTTLATPEPVMVPISAEENTETLAGPPTRWPEQAHGEIGEQADHAGLLEEGAEQDEQIDVGCRHVGRRAVKTFGTERQLVDDLVKAVAAVGQVARQVFAEQAIGKKQRADDRQGDAHHPSRRLEDQDDQHHADDHVGLGQLSGALDQVGLETHW